jgi:hypothetical protein
MSPLVPQHLVQPDVKAAQAGPLVKQAPAHEASPVQMQGGRLNIVPIGYLATKWFDPHNVVISSRS